MGLEIERRFLLANDGWRGQDVGVLLRQGYLSVEPERTVRVRIQDSLAWLTLKGHISARSRHEFEYPIPVADAETLLNQMCPMRVEKRRYRVPVGPHVWEVDEFFGDNAGLFLAEIELAHEDDHFDPPSWLGPEVTDDSRYTNAWLSRHPWPRWATPADNLPPTSGG